MSCHFFIYVQSFVQIPHHLAWKISMLRHAASSYQTLMEPWMTESLASARLAPESSLTEVSDESFETLQAAREERLRPLHAELDAFLERLPADLGVTSCWV
jgi:hypothetical protein